MVVPVDKIIEGVNIISCILSLIINLISLIKIIIGSIKKFIRHPSYAGG